MKPGIKELDRFIKGPFKRRVLDEYENLRILSEADLQAFAWLLIREFLLEYDRRGEKLIVLNKPYFKDLQIHPDLVIFRRKRPWVLVELKERSELTARSAKKEWNRLIRAKKSMKVKPKRAYLIYVARWGNGRVLRGRKGLGAKFFFEIPIVLQGVWVPDRVASWEQGFRKWSKIVEG